MAYEEYIPLDFSPLDNSVSNKVGVSWTYKKHDGYAPNLQVSQNPWLYAQLQTTSRDSSLL